MSFNNCSVKQVFIFKLLSSGMEMLTLGQLIAAYMCSQFAQVPCLPTCLNTLSSFVIFQVSKPTKEDFQNEFSIITTQRSFTISARYNA
jgi:hypothetical protein